MPQATVPDLIKAATSWLHHAKLFAQCQPCDGLAIHLGTIHHCAPEQFQFTVAFVYLRADMGDQAASVDTSIDVMEGATGLFRFAVIKRPESAIGTAIFG